MNSFFKRQKSYGVIISSKGSLLHFKVISFFIVESALTPMEILHIILAIYLMHYITACSLKFQKLVEDLLFEKTNYEEFIVIQLQ